MSAIINSARFGTCAICREDFSSEEQPVTHVGGEGHDGFHATCLKSWLLVRQECPLDRKFIDPSGLISRTDRIMHRIKPALRNAICATSLGLKATLAGSAPLIMMILGNIAEEMRGIEGRLALGILLGLGPGLMPFLTGRRPSHETFRLMEHILMLGLPLAAERVITGTMKVTASLGAALAGRIGIELEERGTLPEFAVALGADQELVQRDLNFVDYKNIGFGMKLGAAVAVLSGVMFRLPEIGLIAGPLIGGCIAGIGSMLRR